MFRLGQRVGCISGTFNAPPCVVRPEKGLEYTIRALREHEGMLFVRLREIVNAPCECWGCDEEAAFDAIAFRPLVSDDVKNEHVLRIIDEAKRELERTKRERASLSMPPFWGGGVPNHFNCRCIAAPLNQ